MFGAVLGGLASSLGGALISNSMANENAQRQDERTRALQEWQAKNIPAMQVQGLRNAGLNPAFQDGAMTPNATGSAPSGPTVDFGTAISALSQASLANAQANLIEKTTPANVRKAENEADITGAEANVVTDELVVSWRKQMYQFQANLLAHQSGLTEAEKDREKILLNQLQHADAKGINQFLLSYQKVKAEISNIKASTKNTNEATQNLIIKNRIDKIGAKIAEEMNILPTDDGLKSMLHMMSSPNGAKIVERLAKNFYDMMEASASYGLNKIKGYLGIPNKSYTGGSHDW